MSVTSAMMENADEMKKPPQMPLNPQHTRRTHPVRARPPPATQTRYAAREMTVSHLRPSVSLNFPATGDAIMSPTELNTVTTA